MNESTQQVGIILIGDELLNGSRQDKHMKKVVAILKERGMNLSWVRIIGDTEEEITANLTQTIPLNDIVFSFGGIGATPDDLTRASAANAFGVELIRHPEAKQIIEEKFGESAYPNRILMADLPATASLLPNVVNRIPGFKVSHHHFVPGFPDMAWPMIDWALDTYYPHLFNESPDVDWRWDLYGVPESSLLDSMNELLNTFSEVRLSSLPNTARRGDLIDFGLKGQQPEVEKASKWFENRLDEMNVEYKFRG